MVSHRMLCISQSQHSALAAFKAARSFFQQQRFSEARAKCFEYRRLIRYQEFSLTDNRPQQLSSCAVIIVIHKASDDVLTCIDNLLKQGSNHSLEIIVVDNEGNEHLQESLELKPVLNIQCPINFLPSEGRNIGAFFTRAPLLIFIDDDGVPASDYIAQALKAMSPSTTMGVRGRVLPRTPDSGVASHYDLGDTPSDNASFNLEGNMVIRRHIFRVSGGFDPLMFGHEGHELAERCYRLKPQADIKYWPELVLKHDFAEGTRLKAKLERQALGNAYRQWLKKHQLPCIPPEIEGTKSGTSLAVHIDTDITVDEIIDCIEPLAGETEDHSLEVLLLVKENLFRQQDLIKKITDNFLGRIGLKILPRNYWLSERLFRFFRFSSILLIDGLPAVVPLSIGYCLEILEKYQYDWIPLPLSQKVYGALMYKDSYALACKSQGSQERRDLQVFLKNMNSPQAEAFRHIERQIATHNAQQYLAKRQHTKDKSLKNTAEGLTNRLVHKTDAFKDENLVAWHPPARNERVIAFIGSRELFNKLSSVIKTIDLLKIKTISISNLPDFQYSLLLVESHLSSANQDVYEKACSHWVDTFQTKGIPSCFWYTEPVHHLYLFQKLAIKFDYVAAVENQSAEKLQHMLGSDKKPVSVTLLGPCIASAQNNAIRQYKQPSFKNLHVLYDGWADLIEHHENQWLIEALGRDDVLITDSRWRFNQLKLKETPSLHSTILGCITQQQRHQALKEFNIALFTSRTLKSFIDQKQDILEALAAKSRVIFFLHENDELTFADLYPFIEYHRDVEILAQRLKALKSDLLECKRLAQPGWRYVHQQHTIENRLSQWLALVDKRATSDQQPPLISCLTVTNRPQWINQVVDNFCRQEYLNKELLIALNTDQPDREAITRQVRAQVPDAKVFQFGSERNLGFCLNWLINQSRGAYWAKMDDDDHYGPNYLMDYWLNTRAIDSDLIGKKMSATYFEASGKTFYRAPEAINAQDFMIYEGNHHHMAGATFFAKRELLGINPFSESRRSSIDVEFFRGAISKGLILLMADDFNFTVYRAADKKHHTWKEDDTILMNKARELSSQEVNV